MREDDEEEEDGGEEKLGEWRKTLLVFRVFSNILIFFFFFFFIQTEREMRVYLETWEPQDPFLFFLFIFLFFLQNLTCRVKLLKKKKSYPDSQFS